MLKNENRNNQIHFEAMENILLKKEIFNYNSSKSI